MSTWKSEKFFNTRFIEGSVNVLITDQVLVADRVIATDKARYHISESINHCKIVLNNDQIDSLLDILMRMKVNGHI